MKRSAVPMAMLAAGALAQEITTTITYSVCPTATTTTITLPTTITYCPGGFCNVTPSGGIGGTVTTTATTTSYITVFPYPCPKKDGMCGASYTIWEECPCTEHKPGYLPKDFTTTLHKCNSCGKGGKPTETIVTVPCTDGAYATQTPSYDDGWKGPKPEIPIVDGKPVAPAKGWDDGGKPVADAEDQWADNGKPADPVAADSQWADNNKPAAPTGAAPAPVAPAAKESQWADNNVADYKGAASKAALTLSTVFAGAIGALALML